MKDALKDPFMILASKIVVHVIRGLLLFLVDPVTNHVPLIRLPMQRMSVPNALQDPFLLQDPKYVLHVPMILLLFLVDLVLLVPMVILLLLVDRVIQSAKLLTTCGNL